MEREKIESLLDEMLKKIERIDGYVDYSKYRGKYVTTKGVAEILNCSIRTVQTLRDNGKLRYSRPLGGSLILFDIEDVIKIVEDGFTE